MTLQQSQAKAQAKGQAMRNDRGGASPPELFQPKGRIKFMRCYSSWYLSYSFVEIYSELQHSVRRSPCRRATASSSASSRTVAPAAFCGGQQPRPPDLTLSLSLSSPSLSLTLSLSLSHSLTLLSTLSLSHSFSLSHLSHSLTLSLSHSLTLSQTGLSIVEQPSDL